MVGDIEMGRVGGECEAGLGLGLELKLLGSIPPPPWAGGPPSPDRLAFDPGVTASKAEPRLPGKLYGEKRWLFNPWSGDTGVWPAAA